MRVAVIGAGFSGLAATKCCLDENVEVVCFERDNDIGGVWRYTEGGDKGSVCHSTVINSSRDMMSLSDFPVPSHFPLFMHNSKVMEYARSYAETFNLLSHIKFSTNIISVICANDYKESGKWTVTHQQCGKEITSQVTECFDAVLVCSGHHWKMNYPSYPGMSIFKGKQMHSKQYRDAKELEDKNVLVVGVGNSGGDIAVDLSRYAKNVYLSTRRGAWVWSRYIKGYPRDKFMNRRFLHYCIPNIIRRKQAFSLINRRIDHVKYGLKPSHDLFAQHPMVNEDLPRAMLNGQISVKPNVKEICEHKVVFEDGSSVDDVDSIIYSTGFQFGFPFIDDRILKVEQNQLPCYKYIFPTTLKHPSLALIGFVQPLGSTIPVAEMQCRVALKVFLKQCTLPSQEEMVAEIVQNKQQMQESYYESPRHTIQVNYISYMDDLANMIGCLPRFWSLLCFDPRLWLCWYFGPCIPSQYRLFGPNSWSGARQIVCKTEHLTFTANKTRSIPEDSRSIISSVYVWIVVILAVFFYLLFCFA